MSTISDAHMASSEAACETATNTQYTNPNEHRFTNYVSYRDPVTLHSRVGHYDVRDQLIQPLSFSSGAPICNLYQVIEA